MAKKTNTTINGNKYYRIYRKVGMKMSKHGVWVDDRKAFYGETKKEAEEKYREYMKSNNHSVDKKCVGELMDMWLETTFKHSDLSESTKLNYESAYKNNFKGKPIAGKLITEITPLDLQKFYNDNVDKIAPGTMTSLSKIVRKFFKYADLNGFCRDITASVTVPKRRKTDSEEFDEDVTVWEDEHVKKIIQSLEGDTKRLLIVLAANTGARIAELLALTYDDIKDNVLIINKQLAERSYGEAEGFHLVRTKSSCSNRAIPLTDEVMKEVEKHKKLHQLEMQANGYETKNIFTTNTGQYYYRRNLQVALKRLYDRIDVPYHNFHSYRHTFGTNLSRAGVPIEETAKLMGHSSVDVTAKYYINVDAKRKLEAVQKITGYSL